MTMVAPKVQSSSGRRAPSYMVIGYYMRRFRGEAENKVDTKGRVSIPAAVTLPKVVAASVLLNLIVALSDVPVTAS